MIDDSAWRMLCDLDSCSKVTAAELPRISAKLEEVRVSSQACESQLSGLQEQVPVLLKSKMSTEKLITLKRIFLF